MVTAQRSVKASIIIPAYNEQEAIGGALEALFAQPRIDKYKVIVVDDGSTDETAEICRRYDVRLIQHQVNRGYGAALKTGIRNADSEKVIVMDGDGQHDPGCIEKITEMLNDYPLVIGQRTKESEQATNRMVGKRIVRIIAEYLMEQPLPDFNSGLRGFQRSKIYSMLHVMPNGFSFSTTSTLTFLKQAYQIGTIPIKTSVRIGRKSNVKLFRDGAKTILLIIRICVLFHPLKIFVPASCFFALLGICWGTWGIFLYHRMSNTALLILLLSLFLFFIGLLADQISLLNLRETFISNQRDSD